MGRLLALALIVAACSEPPSPRMVSLPPPERAVTPTTEAPVAPATPAAPVAATAPAAPSPEILAEVQRIVREARALEHAGDHRAALSRFDDALRLVPRQPRVSCEAGFIAHRAGETALAAQRIDTAIAVFGPERTISDRLRNPLAMCLYNRGIVAEAMSEPRVAEDAFASSLRLRPNATVEAALARARAAVAALPDGPPSAPDDDASHVGGVVLGEGYLLVTDAVDGYESALRSGLRGFDEWTERYVDPSTTRVRRWAALTGTSHPDVAVHTVASAGMPLTEHRLVIGWRMPAGYTSYLVELGTTDEGSDRETETRLAIDRVDAQWAGLLLRIDVQTSSTTSSTLFYTGEGDEPCQDGTDETVTSAMTVICRQEEPTEPWVACMVLRTSMTSPGAETYSYCGDDDAPSRTGEPLDARAVIEVRPDGVQVSQLRDPDAVLGLVEGFATWSELEGGDTAVLTEWISDEEAADTNDGD